jgi:tRNA-specific 2-thiouridylase
MVTGIGLLSGGLDSILATRVLQDQGIRVIGVSFVTPFFGSKRAQKAAEMLNIHLKIIDITQLHIMMLKSPKYGYGKQMNPCIDCHGLMFKEAGKIMEAEGADFLFSGEVLGERPMSQNPQALKIVAKESGYPDLLLRPLSAKLLPETRSEQEGKVDREKLLDISGRGRKRQIELAKHYGITGYAQPAGGCLLTEPTYVNRLQELMAHNKDMEIRDIQLLAVGRHFRLNTGEKVIVGRNHEDNIKLLAMKNESDIVMNVSNYPGSIVIIPRCASQEVIAKAAAICARYSDAPRNLEVNVRYSIGGREYNILAKAADDKEINSIRCRGG